MGTTPEQRPVPTYRLYREQTGESGDFWIHCETIPARTHLHNWEIAVHRHEAFFQLFLVTCGLGELLSPLPMPFTAPCAIFIPRGVAHGFRFSRDIDGLVLTSLAERLTPLAGSDRTIADFLTRTRIVSAAPEAEESRRLVSAMDGVASELATPLPARALALDMHLMQALLALVRLGLHSQSGGGTADPGADRFQALEVLVAAHFREQPSVAFLASRIGVSPTHLNRIARRHGGLSVGGLVARHLLEAAQRELVFTPTPVQAIAYSLGFSDPAYFNRFFRSRTGMTPGAFRQSERLKLAG